MRHPERQGEFDGYRQVPGVDPRSSRDTFVAARLWIDNPRWRGVPFYLRTGKQMAASAQRVSLILREPPGPLHGRLPRDAYVLSFSMAGDGEIDLSLVAKKPGPALELDVAHASIPPEMPDMTCPCLTYLDMQQATAELSDVVLGPVDSDPALLTTKRGSVRVVAGISPVKRAGPFRLPNAPGVTPGARPAASRGGDQPAHLQRPPRPYRRPPRHKLAPARPGPLPTGCGT